MKGFYYSLLKEYGVNWTKNRFLYALKIKSLNKIPKLENLFEKEMDVSNIDIFEINVNSLKDFLLDLPEKDKEEIINIADNACNGKIWTFSSEYLDYGFPIKWNYNPITDKYISNEKKWYSIPDFDKTTGDIKVVWEASRFTHLYYMARAYLLTDDKKYYLHFSQQIKQWLAENKYSFGPNYKCGQENALRMINVLMVYQIFKNSNLITDEDTQNVKTIVKYSYKKIISNFFYAHKCIKNNHTFSEICGLMVGAACSNNMEHFEKYLDLLGKEIVNQFNADGGFTQYSFNYHRFTLQILNVCIKLVNQLGYKIQNLDRVKNSVELLHLLISEKGDLPNYGSNDGALIFPLSSSEYRDFRHVINTTYAMITNHKLYSKGNFDEELIWFIGHTNQKIATLNKETKQFNESGYYIFKHESGYLFTTLQNYKSRPAHMDQLHIDLWHKDINVFCDLGTYSYASDLGKKLASTEGHNTVKVRNINQMNKKNAFFIMDWTKIKAVNVNNSQFNGALVSKNGYIHERSIKTLEKSYIIADKVDSKNKCEFQYNTPCDITKIDGGLLLSLNGVKLCKILSSEEFEITTVERSLYYHHYDKINKIIFKGEMCSDGYKHNLKIELL